MTKVLDHGHVILERHSGSDLDIVCAARQSFDQKSEWEKVYSRYEPWDEAHPHDGGEWVDYGHKLSDKDAGLINYLMKNKHGSPFEHVFFSFSVRAPLFVSTQWVRHRAGHSFNFESGRYSELREEFYVPEQFRTQVGKPGAYRFEDIPDLLPPENILSLTQEYEHVYETAWDAYTMLLEAGVAKEQARMVLPVATYTSFTWSVNSRSLMHWLGLRNSEHSQWEIKQFAIAAEREFERVLPVTHAAFLENGRVAP